MRGFSVFLAALLLWSQSADSFIMRGGFSVLSPSTAGFHDLQIGAGGNNSGMTIADNGDAVVRTDGAGAYVKAHTATVWTQLVTVNSMPAGEVTVDNWGGVYAVTICNANTQVIYIYFNGFIYRSANQGATFTKTNFAQIAAGANDGNRNMGRFMACDPADTTGNNLIVGTESAKAWFTTDGSNFTQITSITATSAGNNILVAYDRSTSSGGATPGIYLSSYGTGVYHTTTGPSGTWTLTTGTPTTHAHMTVTLAGTVLLTSGTSIKAYNGSAWSTPLTTGSDTLNCVAADPGNSNNYVAISPGGSMWVSLTGLAGSWASTFGDTTVIGDLPWYAVSHSSTFTSLNGDCAFDPSKSSVLQISGGNFGEMTTPIPGISFTGTGSGTQITVAGLSGGTLTAGQGIAGPGVPANTTLGSQVSGPAGGNGVYNTAPGGTITTSGQLVYVKQATYTTIATGIEQLDATAVLAPPGVSTIVLGSADDPIWYKTQSTLQQNADAYRPSYDSISVIQPSMSFDWAPGSTCTIVGILDASGVDTSGYSTDCGNTWTKFTSVPASANGNGGNIAMASSTNWCWAGYGATSLYCTTNGGTNPTWTASTGLTNCTNSGLSPPNEWNGGGEYVGNVIAADKVTANTFYLYCTINSGATTPGVYKSSNSGASFTKVNVSPSGGLDTSDGFNMTWKTSPTVAGDIWLSSGAKTGRTHPDTGKLWRSTDAGVNWNQVGTFQEVSTFGFGAQVSGHSYPSICVVGYLNSNANSFGTYQSLDNGATWTQLGTYPLGSPDFMTGLDGDKLIQGQWYFAFHTSSYMYYTP